MLHDQCLSSSVGWAWHMVRLWSLPGMCLLSFLQQRAPMWVLEASQCLLPGGAGSGRYSGRYVLGPESLIAL